MDHKWTRRLDNQYRKNFNITYYQYVALLESQDRRCAICQRHEDDNVKGGKAQMLCVDHCHSTNQVRGLLCWTCNAAIGNLGDTVEGVKRAITYLERGAATLIEYDEPKPHKPHTNRARWKTIVRTDKGETFDSLESASKAYGVHPATIREWAGLGKKSEKYHKLGWSGEKVFK